MSTYAVFKRCARCAQTKGDIPTLGRVLSCQCIYLPVVVRHDWCEPGKEPPFCYELWNAFPGCDHDIQCASGGGVKCTKCGGWYCF